MSFLKAEWRKLAMANFEIDPAILADHVPYGTELDLWQGRCYVSLVGFMFINTKVLGVKIPFHINFEEVNLRFYVRKNVNGEWRRGVVFIKEIVPKPAITWVANTLYKENYATMPMAHNWADLSADKQEVAYKWQAKSEWQQFRIRASKTAQPIAPGSEAEFITEHYWGYAKVNDNKTNEYEVTHPRWQQYAVLESEISVDFERSYGAGYAFLNLMKPVSVLLAEGSEITVEPFQTSI